VREIRTEIEIGAPAATVWKILTDFEHYPAWNPFIMRIEGKLVTGAKLVACLRPPGGRGMTFRPTVTRVDPGREFRWLGHFLVSGVFDGEHIFEVEPVGDRRTKLVQREEFRGFLAGLMLRMIGDGTEDGFRGMNRALRRRAEEV